MKRKLIIGYVAIVFCIALSLIVGNGHARPAPTIAPAADVIDLKNLDQLKEAFQRDRGAVRLVSLLSPV